MRLLVGRVLGHDVPECIGGRVVLSLLFVETGQFGEKREVHAPQGRTPVFRPFLVPVFREQLTGVEVDGHAVGRRFAGAPGGERSFLEYFCVDPELGLRAEHQRPVLGDQVA